MIMRKSPILRDPQFTLSFKLQNSFSNTFLGRVVKLRTLDRLNLQFVVRILYFFNVLGSIRSWVSIILCMISLNKVFRPGVLSHRFSSLWGWVLLFIISVLLVHQVEKLIIITIKLCLTPYILVFFIIQLFTFQIWCYTYFIIRGFHDQVFTLLGYQFNLSLSFVIFPSNLTLSRLILTLVWGGHVPTWRIPQILI